MSFHSGVTNGFYVGIEGQAHARQNATAIVQRSDARFYKSRVEVAFEDKGDDGVLVTCMWDNAVASCELMGREAARARWKFHMDKGGWRTK